MAKKLDPKFVLFNLAGGFAILIVGVYTVHMALYPETLPPCSRQYATVIELPFERSGGEPISAAELQARLAGRDHGVLENARIVRVGGVASPVLEVKLAKGTVGPRTSVGLPGGIGFQWRPTELDRAEAACLSYSVRLPEDFDFKRGGTLPGLYGSGENNRGEERTQFAVRYMWREAGSLELLTTLPQGNGETRTTSGNADFLRLERGRWVRLEQEVILNAPGQKDGAIRIWVDGRLFVERTNVSLRESNVTGFSGIQADAHYGGIDTAFAAPKDTHLQLMPFQLRVR